MGVELWMEVHDIVQEAVIKTNPQEKEMQKGKMVDCALQEPVSQSGVNQMPYNYIVEVTNRFKRLDPIDRVPDELSLEVCDIIQEMDQDHPEEKEMQKSKMAVGGGLTNSCEKKRNEKQQRKEKIYPFEYRVPKNSKER